MQYDEDDWQFTHHQKARMLGAIQIDDTEQYESRAQTYWSADIQYDFDYWENPDQLRVDHSRMRYLSDQLRKARKIVDNFSKLTFKDPSSIRAQIYLREYNNALRLLEQYDED